MEDYTEAIKARFPQKSWSEPLKNVFSSIEIIEVIFLIEKINGRNLDEAIIDDISNINLTDLCLQATKTS